MKLFKCFLRINVLFIVIVGVYLGGMCTYNADHNFTNENSLEPICVENPYRLLWGILINAQCTELFISESDHQAFGEGFRYSVLSPSNSVFVNENATTAFVKSETTKATGHGYDSDIDNFFRTIWKRLKVPKEFQYTFMSDSFSWTKLSKDDGSQVCVIYSIDDQCTYIAEVLY